MFTGGKITGIPTIVCGKTSLHMVQYLMVLLPDRCYQQKNRQKAYSLLTVIIKGKIITRYHITVIQFLRYVQFESRERF